MKTLLMMSIYIFLASMVLGFPVALLMHHLASYHAAPDIGYWSSVYVAGLLIFIIGGSVATHAAARELVR